MTREKLQLKPKVEAKKESRHTDRPKSQKSFNPKRPVIDKDLGESLKAAIRKT